jgi:hypothetical protein
MSNNHPFGLSFIETLIDRTQAATAFAERTGEAGGPRMTLTNAHDADIPAGFLRLWAAEDGSHFDRMIHFRLQSDPVDTQLFFLFGRSASVMPHFHAQVVQFSPDACVFNADWLPRLDPIEHPDYQRTVFDPITKAYWKTINDRNNMCALAPANPAIAVFLSPWSIGVGRPTDKAELDRVAPHILAFHDHCLMLSHELAYPTPDKEYLQQRDKKHLECFFDDKLDPRAWKGVYNVIGEETGRRVKDIFKSSLRDS